LQLQQKKKLLILNNYRSNPVFEPKDDQERKQKEDFQTNETADGQALAEL